MIIPVYNVEEYIVKSLESVVKQKGFQEYEVIVVNDGTKDRSIDLIQDIIQENSNIRLIEQKNKGQSEARNAGLRIAKGEYISFVDSDDWIEESMISNLYDAAVRTGSEIAVCNIEMEFKEKSVILRSGFPDKTVMLAEDAIRNYFEHKRINGYLCNKIYKRDLFSKFNIKFPKDKIYEDLPTIFKLLWHSEKIIFLEDCFYHYLQRSGSSTQKLNVKLWHMIENVYLIQSFLKSAGVYEIYQKNFFQLLIFHLFRVHIELQKNKQSLNYKILKKKLEGELENISLLQVMTTSEINVLTKIKFASMKLKADSIIEFLLKAKAYKNRMKTVEGR
ncbi:glycosyltransferase family 2 protein [Planococcus sp. N017]|uniref:Glycosyltransferase family 2 protein n=1 Tax=Planococcus shenhongbingii TaxID=3058398 RepID=A0ABT8N9L6_9BACL|nr:glycosyltransferase family 2 protein [Planococcus sp. N017]MDN7244588.1 glycosyltransferase family 2 protein [Planococcus sp. N017]